jgi:polysaccharide pyruvyl transferase WcaK-like protein
MTLDGRSGVLLYGYFGAGNLGDDLLLAVTTRELRTILPGARIFVRHHGDVAGLTALGPDVALTGIETILADQSRSRITRLWSYLRGYAHLLRRCRWLIFAGGTLFHERGTLTALVLQLLVCLLARIQGVRIAALGVGVAELNSAAGRGLLRRIIGMSELFLVRDDAALRQCAGTKARLTGDLVFAWSGLKPIPRPCGKASRIGLTIYPPACRGPGGAQVRSALVGAIRRWQADSHAIVYLVCQREGVAVGDETVFTQLAAELGPHAGSIETRKLNADAAAVSQQLSDITLVCGMRFHALVIAAMLGRPFIGIAHDNKISEICRYFAMPCYTVDNLAGQNFAADIESTMDRIPDSLLVERARHSAQENFHAFAAIVK